MPHLIIDTGNTAFMLLCSSLVMLMTPGLAFFYGGLVGRKNVLAFLSSMFPETENNLRFRVTISRMTLF